MVLAARETGKAEAKALLEEGQRLAAANAGASASADLDDDGQATSDMEAMNGATFLRSLDSDADAMEKTVLPSDLAGLEAALSRQNATSQYSQEKVGSRYTAWEKNYDYVQMTVVLLLSSSVLLRSLLFTLAGDAERPPVQEGSFPLLWLCQATLAPTKRKTLFICLGS